MNQQGKILTQKKQPRDVIKVSWLQMVRPHNNSQLQASVFHGYFNLCYVLCFFFIIISPLRKYVVKGIFLEDEVVKLLETNITIDIVSVILFSAVGLLALLIPQKILKKIQIPYIVLNLIMGSYITRFHQMYISDRAFVAGLCWGFSAKIFSYANSNNSTNSIRNKIVFFFSPCFLYQGFNDLVMPNRRLNFTYITKKFLVTLVCLIANCILIVQIVDPVIARKDEIGLVELTFNLIPPVFYLYLSLFYTINQNIFAALAEVTKLRDRRFFDDWWNANNLYEYASRFNTKINEFTEWHLKRLIRQDLLPWLENIKMAVWLFFLQVICIQIFNKRWNIKTAIIFLAMNWFITMGGKSKWLNNYIVHAIILLMFPLIIALDVKFHVFS